jgi:hypothetical protein
MNYKELPKASSDAPQIYAQIDDDGVCRVTCTADHPPFLAWISEGNEPLPPDPIPEPEPLTPEQKLEASGLTVEELKELLGL